jgi:hypothetical protein
MTLKQHDENVMSKNQSFTFATMTWLIVMEYLVSQLDHGYVPFVVSTLQSFPHLWLIIGFVTRLIWRVPLVEQELLTFPEHLSSSPVLSGVRVTRSLDFVYGFSLCTFSFCPLSFLFFYLRILITPVGS